MTHSITSYGIINVKINDIDARSLIINKLSTRKKICYKFISNRYPDIDCNIYDDSYIFFNNNINRYGIDNLNLSCKTENDMEKFNYYKDLIYFLMVSRRYSVGFSDFIRGRYHLSDTSSIVTLFEQMLVEEIKEIESNDYDTLVYNFTNRHNEHEDKLEFLNKIYSGRYADEYCSAKVKFNLLKEGKDDVPHSLYFYTQHVKPRFSTAEWGFPKGRQSYVVNENKESVREDSITCAKREFREETGCTNYQLLDKIEPISEKFTGTDLIKYKYIYYVALDCNTGQDLANFDTHETREVKWVTFDEATALIRPFHREKKNILTKMYLFVLNFLINYVE